MPHQCTKCGKVYEDASDALLKGCVCGGKFFFFIKNEDFEKKEEIINLDNSQKKQIENDILDILGIDKSSQPIILDIEAIKVTGPGKYEIDLVKLFSGKPLIYKLEEGKYLIDLIDSFSKSK